MNNNKNLLLLLLGIALTPFLQAQVKSTSEAWTLQECIDHAWKNNISIKRADLNVLQNQASYQQSKAQLYPSLNASASHSLNLGRNQNPTTGVLEDFNAQGGNMGLSANVVLFNGFANYNTIKSNSMMLESALADLAQAKNDVGLNVAQAYLQVLVNEELLNSSKAQLENSKEQLRRTEILVKAGSLAEADRLQAMSQMALNEAQVINNENNLGLSKLQLLQLLQLPYDPNFNVINPDLLPEDLDPVTNSSGEIYEMALTNQPNIKSAEYRIQASEASLAAAKGNRMPSLSLGAGMNSRYISSTSSGAPLDPLGDQLNTNLGQNIGVSLSIPIFNNLRVNQAIQNSSINKERAVLNDIDTKNTLRQQIEQAYYNATAALKTYNSTEKQVEALKLTYENMEKQRDLGAVNSTEFTLAQNNLSAAESDMIRAKYDYIFKLKILDFYQGKPLEF